MANGTNKVLDLAKITNKMMKPITLIDVINIPLVLFSNKSKTINDTRLIHMAKNKYIKSSKNKADKIVRILIVMQAQE